MLAHAQVWRVNRGHMHTCPTCQGSLRPYVHGDGQTRYWCAACGADKQLGAEFPLTLPYPIAFALAKAQSDPLYAVHNLITCAEFSVKLTGLILLADYLGTEHEADAAVTQTVSGLLQPSWWDWTQLTNALGDWARRTGTATASLGTAWLEVGGHAGATPPPAWRSLLAGMKGHDGKQAPSLNDAIWTCRNDRHHRLGVMEANAEIDRPLVAQLTPVVEAQVRHLFPDGGVQLFVQNGQQWFSVRGPTSLTPESPLTIACNSGEPFAVYAGWKTPVALFPLASGNDPEPNQRALDEKSEPIWLLDGLSGGQVVFRGARQSRRGSSLVERVRTALSQRALWVAQPRKHTRLDRLVDYARASTMAQFEPLLAEDGGGRGRYLNRERPQAVIDDALSSPGKGLLVLGDAGTGKSMLLANAAERILSRQSSDLSTREDGAPVVVFLSGGSAYSGDLSDNGDCALVNAVCRKAGLAPAFSTLEELFRHLMGVFGKSPSRFILILDGLDESERFIDLGGALDRLLPSLPTFPWLRLVVSMRTGAYHALARRRGERLIAEGGFTNDRFLHSVSGGDILRASPFLELTTFEASREAAEAWALRCASQPALPAWGQLPVETRELLRVPLFQRLAQVALRAGEGAPIAPRLDNGSLLDSYLDQLVRQLPATGRRLIGLGALLLDERSAVIPATQLASWEQEWTSGAPERLSQLSPTEELVAASVLVPRLGTGLNAREFSFTSVQVCERLLYRELRRTLGAHAPGGADYARWARQAVTSDGQQFKELISAVETIIVESVPKHGAEPMVATLEDLCAPGEERASAAAKQAHATLARWLAVGLRTSPEQLLSPLETAASDAPVERGPVFIDAVVTVATQLEREGALSVALQCAEARLAVARRMPEATLEVIRALRMTARLQSDLLQRPLARQALEEALENFSLLPESLRESANLVLEEARTRRELGRLLIALGHHSEGVDLLSQSADQQLETSMLPPLGDREVTRTAQRDLILTYDLLGDAEWARGDRLPARAYWREAVARVDERLPMPWGKAPAATITDANDLRSCMALNGKLAQVEESDQARHALARARRIGNELVTQFPHDATVARELAVVANLEGTRALDAGDQALAREQLEQSLVISRRLLALEPRHSLLLRDLMLVSRRMGLLESEAGNGARACALLSESLEAARALDADASDGAELANSLWLLAEPAAETGDSATVCRLVEEAYAELQRPERWAETSRSLLRQLITAHWRAALRTKSGLAAARCAYQWLHPQSSMPSTGPSLFAARASFAPLAAAFGDEHFQSLLGFALDDARQAKNEAAVRMLSRALLLLRSSAMPVAELEAKLGELAKAEDPRVFNALQLIAFTRATTSARPIAKSVPEFVDPRTPQDQVGAILLQILSSFSTEASRVTLDQFRKLGEEPREGAKSHQFHQAARALALARASQIALALNEHEQATLLARDAATLLEADPDASTQPVLADCIEVQLRAAAAQHQSPAALLPLIKRLLHARLDQWQDIEGMVALAATIQLVQRYIRLSSLSADLGDRLGVTLEAAQKVGGLRYETLRSALFGAGLGALAIERLLPGLRARVATVKGKPSANNASSELESEVEVRRRVAASGWPAQSAQTMSLDNARSILRKLDGGSGSADERQFTEFMKDFEEWKARGYDRGAAPRLRPGSVVLLTGVERDTLEMALREQAASLDTPTPAISPGALPKAIATLAYLMAFEFPM